MPRYTTSYHFLIRRNVVFLRDDHATEESHRWLYYVLRRDAPEHVLTSNDPAILLKWSQTNGHSETKFNCECLAVEAVKHL